MKSFSLVDLRHAVANDYGYASSYGNPSSNDSVPDNLNNISLGKNCQNRLQFAGIEAKYTDLTEEQSDDERLSEISASEEFLYWVASMAIPVGKWVGFVGWFSFFFLFSVSVKVLPVTSLLSGVFVHRALC